MLNKSFRYIGTLICISLSVSVFAQSTKKDTGDIIVIRGEGYVPVIKKDAFKVSETPQNVKGPEIRSDIQYVIQPSRIDTKFKLEPITAARMSGEPLTKLYKSLIKVGYGTYQTPMAEIFFNTGRSKKRSLGFSYNHLSSNGTIDNFGNQAYSTNNAKGNMSYFYKNHTLDVNANWKRDVVHYYGYSPKIYTDIKEDSIRQRFALSELKTSLYSTYSNHDKLHHRFDLNYYNLFDRFKTMENNVCLKANFDKEIKLDKEMQDEKFLLEIEGTYNSFTNPEDTVSAGLIKIMPAVSFKANDLHVLAGVRGIVEADSTSYLRFFPFVNASLNLADNLVIIYGGINGDVHENTFRTMSTENPFVNPRLNHVNTREKLSANFGIKGNFSSKIAFNASIANYNMINMPLFVTDTTEPMKNRFTVIYDDVKYIKGSGEVSYQKNEKIKFIAGADYYYYQPSTEKQVWHKPSIIGKVIAEYNIQDKIIAKAAIYYYGKTYSKAYDSTGMVVMPHLNKGIVDINIGLEYRYTKILSAFINFNNIAAMRGYPWYNYPNQRFSLIGGLTYAF